MKKTYFFDLDGTLLPMDQDQFVHSYFSRLAKKMAGKIDPKQLVDTIWKGTGAMVTNDGRATNEQVFWQVFDRLTGLHHETLEDEFLDYYRNEFNEAVEACAPTPLANKIVKRFKEKGYTLVLATNPDLSRGSLRKTGSAGPDWIKTTLTGSQPLRFAAIASRIRNIMKKFSPG